jgi:very-short-patch-repair endonuclease
MPRSVIPQPLSAGEEEFALHCACYQLTPEREYRFYPPRRWRFDYAFVPEMIAVEIEGGTWSNGRHNRGKGFEADCIKYAHASIMGWRVLRFTSDQVIRGEAIDLTIACIQGRAL